MIARDAGQTMTARLVDALYTEAMLLADETRSYFDDAGLADREKLPPRLRVEYACEALKGTTRLMLVIAWLLVRKAVDAGELPATAGEGESRRLGEAPPVDVAVLAGLPPRARHLLASGDDLYGRVSRLDQGIEVPPPTSSPVLSLLHRLERSI